MSGRSLAAPLLASHGVQLWMPELGGRVDPSIDTETWGGQGCRVDTRSSAGFRLTCGGSLDLGVASWGALLIAIQDDARTSQLVCRPSLAQQFRVFVTMAYAGECDTDEYGQLPIWRPKQPIGHFFSSQGFSYWRPGLREYSSRKVRSFLR